MAGTGKPTINHDSIDNLDNKIEDYGTTTLGKLSAAEFNQLIHSVLTEQTNVTTLLNNGVFGVKLPGQNAVYPNNEGIVELGSSNAGVLIATAYNQRVFNFYDNNIVISMAVVVNDGNQAATGESVTLEIYRGSGDTPVKTITIQSAYNNPALESDYVDINLSDVILSDISNYRVRAIGTLTPLESTLNLTINYTNVYVEAINSPTSIFRIDTTSRKLEGIHYYAYGNINEGLHKYLYVRVHDDVEATSSYYELYYDIGRDRIEYLGDFQFGNSVDPVTGNPNLVKHGVHLIEAFCVITEDDLENLGLEVTIYTSATVSRRFMFVNDVTDNNIYILLQDITPSIENYTQSMICSYSLFKPIVIDNVISTDTVTDIDIKFQLDYRYQGLSATCAILNSTLKAGVMDTLILEPEATLIGSNEPSSYQALIYAYHTYEGDVTETDLIASSGYSAQEVTMTLVNNVELSPIPGAIFVINPKLHSSSNNGTIFNDKDATQAVVSSTWNIHGNGLDGWLYNSVLRLIANDTIEITEPSLRPFGLFKYGSGVEISDRSIAIEFDMVVSNVTDETKPIITIGYTDSNQMFKGIKLFPTSGYVFTKDAHTVTNLDFLWQEGERIHIGITVTYLVECNYGDNTYRHYLDLIRVFLDGQIQREIVYTVDNPEASWTDDDYQFPVNANIVLGGESADLDIYSLRLYSAKALSAHDSLKDYIATKATTTEKMEIYNRNQITYAAGTANAGRISANLVRGLGKNVLIWYGPECKNEVTNAYDPYPTNTGGSGGYWGVWQYNSDGTLDDLHSGYLCRLTGMKEYKSQGTTAKTYYYHNIQTKVKGRGNIPVNWQTDIDSNYITVTLGTGADEGKVILNGGGFSNKKFEYDENNMISVPDGWVSFGGLYRGAGFQVTEDSPFAVKLVNKINYASAMQSHLDGGVMSYNDLHKAVVGANALQRGTNVRVTKCVQPFFFFVEDENHADNPVYRGLCTFGSGKADDPTWGYTGQTTFMMVEGASNNAPLADMRVPWDDEVEPSFDGDELDGWIYNGATNVDLDKCTFVTDEQSRKICNPDALALVKKAFNYLYWHNTNIAAYENTRLALLNDTSGGLSPVKSYWTSDHYLMRYDFKTSRWVDAGFKGSTLISDTNTYYKKRKLDTQINLENDEDYNDSVILAGVNWNAPTTAEVTELIINSYAAHAAQDPTRDDPTSHGLSQYFKIKSLLFHYAYVNYYIAGTDNCSKNTYYVFIPGDNVFELHQDDLDTIFMTDNSGNQTKPYYIDRQHPYDDNDTGHTNILYEGKDNVLFNLCERMFGGYSNDLLSDGSITIRSVMLSIFQSMQSLAGNGGSIWKFMDKYFFSIQKYFPEVAWNEQAMVRYEYPEAIGYLPTMAPKPGRPIPPITLSIGSLLQAEMQYIKKRTILAASYAHFGSLGGKSELIIGIPDCSDSFSAYTTNIGLYNVKFKVKAFQYIYPSWVNGDQAYSTCLRVGPNDGYFLLPEFPASSADQVCGLQGSNFYTMVDDETGERMGDNPFYDENFSARGSRLKKFVSHPVTNPSVDLPSSGITTSVIFLGIKNSNTKVFNCIGIPNVTEFDIQGCVYTKPTNLSSLIHATRIILKDSAFDSANSLSLPINGSMEVLDLRGTPTVTTNIADCDTLQTIYVSHQCVNLTITNCPNLASIIIENESGRTSMLENITLSGLTSLSLISLVPSIKQIIVKNCELFTGFSNTTTAGVFQNIQVIDMKTGNSSSLGSYGIINGIIRDQLNLETLNLTTIKFSNISWGTLESGGFSGSDLDIILQLDKNNIDLTGIIYMNSGNGVMNFARKKLVLEKIDNFIEYNQYNSTTALTNLAIKYTVVSLTSATVSGSVYTRELGNYQYNVEPNPTGANNFRSITWSIDTVDPDPALVTVEMESDTGLLKLTAGLLTTQAWTYIRCSIVTFNSTSFVTDNDPLVASKKVWLYNRPAEVGDFVYADGEYSNEFYPSKTLIGVCVFIGDKDNGDFYDGTYALQNNVKVQDRLCVCCNNITVSGSDTYNNLSRSYSDSSLQFGLYRNSNNVPSTTEVVKILTSTSGEPYKLESDSTYNCYDSPIDNISYSYESTGSFTMSTSWLENTYRDGTNTGTLDGYAKFPTNRGLGSGFACDDTDLSSRLVPPMDSSNSLRYVLPTDENGDPLYSEGDLLNKGFMNTLQWILHRNKLLTDNTFAGTELNPTFRTEIPSDKFNDANELIKTEMQDLGGKLATIPYIVNDDLRIEPSGTHGTITDYDRKYRQLYYPAVSACYAYEPTLLHEGEILNLKFKKHNWFLPTLGLLVRMYYLYKYPLTGWSKTIFANAYDECVVNGSHKFSNFSASYYWSSTELNMYSCWHVLFYNGYTTYNYKYSTSYVRALVAF